MERIADILSSNLSLDELLTMYHFVYAIEMILFLPLLIPIAPVSGFWEQWFLTRKTVDFEERDRHYWFIILCVFTFLIWIPISIAAFEGGVLLLLIEQSIPHKMFMTSQSMWIRGLLLGTSMILATIITVFQKNVEKQ